MAISKERKKELLLESFEVLKTDPASNSGKLKEIISKISKLDIDLAKEMWEYIAKFNKKIIRNNRLAYDFCGGIIYGIDNATSTNQLHEILRESKVIRESVYKESGDICCSTYYSVQEFVKANETQLSDEMIGYIYNNKYKSQTFEEVFEAITNISSDVDLDEDTVEMLLSWVEKIKNKQARAAIMVNLSEHM